jgi:enterochelin esterase-like enzyme
MNKNCVKMSVPLATSLYVCCLLVTLPVLSQASDDLQELERSGELIAITVPAPSLQANAFAIPAEQPVSIYLPPSYQSSSERYPVVYFLPGFGDLVHYYTIWGVFGFSLKPAMDQLISTGKIREMIVVIPNGSYFLQGSFYVNSPLSGNWEDYITKDVVSYVDANYRTIASSASRGLSGHSMGGFGALFIAMRHPDVFSAVYALSPGLAEPNGLMQHDMFVNEGAIRRTLALMDTLSRLSENEAKVVLMSSVNSLLNSADLPGVFAIAYGMAFSPRKDGKPPFFEYPYSMVDGKPVLNSKVWARWEAGFGDLADKITEYKTNLQKLRALFVEVGIHDEHVWLPPGCKAFAALLRDNGIPLELVEFEGAHQDQLKQRLEEHMLPEMSRMLERNH